MSKTFIAVVSALLLVIPSGIAVAVVDPASIHGVYGGNVCGVDVQGNPGTALTDGGYYNTGGAVAGVDPAIFPAGFFDNPSHYCFQETEHWINLGSGSIGGDTVNEYGWYRFNAEYTGTPGQPVLYPTAYPGKNNIKEHYSFTGGPSAAALTVSIVANPSSITSGEQSLLTWSSTGAVSCWSSSFNTGDAISGSVAVSPSVTTQYKVTCSGAVSQSTTAGTTVNHTEADAYNSPAVIADMQAHGGINLPAVQGNSGFSPNQVTMDHVCVLIDGTGATASNIGARSYSSPGNNAVISYNGSTWVRTGGVSSHMSTSFTCAKPGTTVSTAGPTASAVATVAVSSPADTGIQVSCRAHPSRAGIGEDVLWSSTVTGPVGTYTYSWSGTDGLTGTSNEVFKKYTTVGQKDAWLSVTYDPNAASTGDTGAAACLGDGEEVPAGHLCSVGGLGSGGGIQTKDGTIEWGACCSGVARTHCPAPNEPAEAYCVGAGPKKTGGTTTGTAPTTPTTPVACPAIGWVAPTTPCSGSWQPLMTSGCQSGWQCVAGPATTATNGGGAGVFTGSTVIDSSISSLINLFSTPSSSQSPSQILQPQSVNSQLDSGCTGAGCVQGATATTIAHTETQAYTSPAVIADMQAHGGINLPAVQGNSGFSPDQTSMDRVCVLIDGPGATATAIGARGYNSPGNNAVISYNGTTWIRTGGVKNHMSGSFSCIVPGTPTPPPAQCSAGQTETPTINYGGGSCVGGTQIAKQTEILDGAQIGQLPDGWLVNTCTEMGAQQGDCCEYSQRASNNTGGGFPPNSYWQVRVVRGGTTAIPESTYVTGVAMCSGLNQNYSCSSTAGIIGASCSSTPPPPPPPQPPQRKTVTVKCESGVFISTGTGQCADGVDNNGDGLIDALDPGCLIGLEYNPNGDEGGSNSNNGNGTLPQCSDGIDNNGDGKIDFPEDPGCSSANDNLEQSDPADVSLAMTPPIIKKGQSCTINLSARHVRSCTLTGTGINRTFVPIAGIVSATQLLTPALTLTATYNLSCMGTNGKVTAKSVDCKVAPTFEEF